MSMTYFKQEHAVSKYLPEGFKNPGWIAENSQLQSTLDNSSELCTLLHELP
jgi:hypothetical protein